jgi:5-methylcytosine-specific restriction endonuclease McrA
MVIAMPHYNLSLPRRTENYCAYCGKQLLTYEGAMLCDFVSDHMIPKCQGGKDSQDNLINCCPRCNSSKGGKNVEQFRESLKERVIKQLNTAMLRVDVVSMYTGLDEVLPIYQKIAQAIQLIEGLHVPFYIDGFMEVATDEQ